MRASLIPRGFAQCAVRSLCLTVIIEEKQKSLFSVETALWLLGTRSFFYYEFRVSEENVCESLSPGLMF